MSTDKPQGDKFTAPKNWVNPDPTFTIFVKESGKRIEGLRVDGTIEQEKMDSTIVFITPKGKKWKMHFHEFSFVFPSTQPKAA